MEPFVAWESIKRGLSAVKRWLIANPKDRPWERALIRVLVPLLFIASGVTAALIASDTDSAPGIAFDNRLVFAGLLFLAIFYGALLLLLPLARAIFAGELPIELTTTGPRYPERELASSREASEKLQARVDEVEKRLDEVAAVNEGSAAAVATSLDDLAADVLKLQEAVEGP